MMVNEEKRWQILFCTVGITRVNARGGCSRIKRIPSQSGFRCFLSCFRSLSNLLFSFVASLLFKVHSPQHCRNNKESSLVSFSNYNTATWTSTCLHTTSRRTTGLRKLLVRQMPWTQKGSSLRLHYLLQAPCWLIQDQTSQTPLWEWCPDRHVLGGHGSLGTHLALRYHVKTRSNSFHSTLTPKCSARSLGVLRTAHSSEFPFNFVKQRR